MTGSKKKQKATKKYKCFHFYSFYISSIKKKRLHV